MAPLSHFSLSLPPPLPPFSSSTKVGDFGLSRKAALVIDASGQGPPDNSALDALVAASSQHLGTVQYTAPEVRF